MDASSDTRERILTAAIEVVARDGAAKATSRAIAQEAGVAQGLANYHFGSRRALIGEAIAAARDRYMAAVAQAAPAHASGPEALRQTLELTRAILDFDDRWYRVLSEVTALALRDETMAEDARAITTAGTAAVRQYIDLVRAAFGLEPFADDESDLVSAVALEAFNGLAVRRLLDPEFDHEAAFGVLERMLIAVIAPGHEPVSRPWRSDPLALGDGS